jgi:hypothetical protein
VQDIKPAGSRIVTPTFFNSEVHGFKESVSWAGRFTPGDMALYPRYKLNTKLWWGPEPVYTLRKVKIFCPCPESNHSPVFIPTKSLTLVEN